MKLAHDNPVELPNFYNMNRRTVPVLLILALACQLPARAELFRPATVKGALIGGVAGAVIGHNNDRRGWEGAAYGMAAGAIVGSIVGEARAHDHQPRPYRSYRYGRHRGWDSHAHWHLGLGYHRAYPARWHHLGHRSVYDHGPSWAWHTGHYDRHPWGTWHGRQARQHRHYHDHRRHPSYAARGIFWGGLAGAIIGHNHGRHGWEGAGYGAAGGYILGSLADARARQRAAEAEAAEAWARAAMRPTQGAARVNITINNTIVTPASASPMAAANRAFGR